MNKHHKIILCFLINLSFVNSGVTFADISETEADINLTDQIRDIIERNQTNWDSAKTMSGSVKIISEMSYEDKEGPQIIEAERFWYDGFHLRSDVLEKSFTGQSKLVTIKGKDGLKGIASGRPEGMVEIKSNESYLSYLPPTESVIIVPPKRDKVEDLRRSNVLLKYQSIMGPTLREVVLSNAKRGIYCTMKSDKINEDECSLLEFDFPNEICTRIWIVPSKGCAVKRVNILNKVQVVEEYTTNLKEYSPGIWCIDSVKAKHSAGGILNYTVEVSVDSLTINEPIDPKTFALEGTNIPSGTRVMNRITGERYTYVNEPVPPSLIGKILPDFNDIKIKLLPADIVDKRMLICFFDMEQRPSRNCLRQLSTRAKELKAKDIFVIAVQASKVERTRVDGWIKENNIPFPVGTITDDEEKIRFTWGIRSLPWLILTDADHVVRSQGFSIDELDAKINAHSED